MDLRYGIAGALVIGLALGGAIPFVSADGAFPWFESGEWYDTNQPNCRVWNPNPHPGETVAWTGDCVDGKAHGAGTATWTIPFPGNTRPAAIETYRGHYAAGRMFGSGRYINRRGDVLEGEWQNGSLNGQGRARSAVAGWQYEGTWRDGVFHGFGAIRTVEGIHYEGEWRDGAMHGRGVLTAPNGAKYEGEWREGEPQNEGLVGIRTLRRRLP